MATMLLLAGAPLALSGCLLFEDPSVLPQIPPELNGPMVLLPTGMKPEQIRTTFNPQPQCKSELQVLVDDEDQSGFDGGVSAVQKISLHSLWFVDNGQALIGQQAPPWSKQPIVAPPSVYSALNSLVGGVAEHLVEVRVTDGEYAVNPAGDGYIAQRPPIILPDGTQAPDRVYEVSNVWFLTLEAACPPQP